MKLANLSIQESAENALEFSDLISEHVPTDKLQSCIKAYRQLIGLGFDFKPAENDVNPHFIDEDEDVVVYIAPSGREFWLWTSNGVDEINWGGGGLCPMHKFGAVDWKSVVNGVRALHDALDTIDGQLGEHAKLTQED
jgi:hypothetical protein